MSRPQVLLTKDELFDRVWPGLAVSEAVLTTAVKELRRALGDDARAPRVIETVHGRGYRFLLPVALAEAPPVAPASAEAVLDAPLSPSPPSPRRLWMVGALLLILIAAPLATYLLWTSVPKDGTAASGQHPKSIAVLPFRDLSPGGTHGWFADGLTEELSNSLARVPDLRVPSRASAALFGGPAVDTRRAAASLGVAHLLEGSVRISGDRVRVTVRVIRAADGYQLWSETYDRPGRDIISIQEDIAFAIASALRTVMEPARLRAMTLAGTRSVEAYEAYLRGLSHDQRQFADGDLAHSRLAAEAYERARQLDPEFAAAHWLAAKTWFGNATRIDSTLRDGMSEQERLARFFERINAAIAASDDDTERLRYIAYRSAMQLRPREAFRTMLAYLRARPRDIDGWELMAEIAAWSGQRRWIGIAAARVHQLSVEQGDPRSRAITLSVMAMDIDAAIARTREQLALRPERALAQYQGHRALVWGGRVAEARELLGRIDASDLPIDNRLLARLRQACVEGRRADALNLRREIDALPDLNSSHQAAQILGDEAAAVELLKPLDVPDRLPTLMQYMIQPTFDASAYPLLSARLRQNGITIPAAVPTPGACPAAADGPQGRR